MKKYRYSKFDKFKFYSSYAFYKLYSLFEIRKPKLQLFLADIRRTVYVTVNQILKHAFVNDKCIYGMYSFDYIETKFGKFHIRRNTMDGVVVTPSFERQDVNFLLQKLNKELSRNSRILVLDIGADIGYYSILTSNYFKGHPSLSIHGYEPSPDNRALFEKNVRINGVSNIVLYPYAIYNRNDVELVLNINAVSNASNTVKDSTNISSSVAVKARTLDSLYCSKIEDYDSFFLKIDIEGSETEALQGAEVLLNSGKTIFVMVEDFIDSRVLKFLEASKAKFIGKYSDYNSWWEF